MAKQILEINKSILKWFIEEHFSGNEQDYQEKRKIEFQIKLTKAINVNQDNIEIKWVEKEE